MVDDVSEPRPIRATTKSFALSAWSFDTPALAGSRRRAGEAKAVGLLPRRRNRNRRGGGVGRRRAAFVRILRRFGRRNVNVSLRRRPDAEAAF
jgi:hypothetical protein